ncbi:hypothetical protein [Ralstonia phage RSL2]|uniref:Uncharacterized protein n=2 Tax=Ralstonia phage RSL2 TaxID=1585840 RepID=A0A0A8JBB5_9CAUD|nr:hypothetical protein [Ralstonia phage RSL2]
MIIMQTLENLNSYFGIFEEIVFEGKGFARVGKDFGISVAAVHARYEYIRMAVCRELLLLPPNDDNQPLLHKLFHEDGPGRDILTVLRACIDEIRPYYRAIRAKMKFIQMKEDDEHLAMERASDVEALRATCESMAGDKYAIAALSSIILK